MIRYISILLVLSLGCGDTETPPPPPTNNPQPDMELDGVDPPDMVEPDMPIDPNEGCSAVEDLGVLGDSRLIEAQLEAPEMGHTASCQTSEIESGSKIYRFTVESEVQLTITADAIPRMVGEIVIPPPPALELREAACSADGTDMCSAERTRTYNLAANTPYFLVINGDIESDGVRLDMEVTDLVCTPGVECSDSNMNFCVDGTAVQSFPCAQDCASDAHCEGDTCEFAITLPSTGTHRIVGSRTAYTDTWNAQGRGQACGFFAGEDPLNTPNSDLVVRIPNLPAGTSVLASAENPENEGRWGFFFSTTCEANTCLAAGSFDSNGFNEALYITEDAGDLFIRVESLEAMERKFTIDFVID